MTTDKERAAHMRKAAEHIAAAGDPMAAWPWRARADELDPPKPTWPEGTIAWITDFDGIRRVAVRHDGCWRRGDGELDRQVVVDNDSVTKVEPLRVLGDDEIALPVVTKAVGQLGDYADYLRREYFYGNCGSAVLSAYVKAVQMAEAGDAK